MVAGFGKIKYTLWLGFYPYTCQLHYQVAVFGLGSVGKVIDLVKVFGTDKQAVPYEVFYNDVFFDKVLNGPFLFVFRQKLLIINPNSPLSHKPFLSAVLLVIIKLMQSILKKYICYYLTLVLGKF
jgi:hypothetical protein